MTRLGTLALAAALLALALGGTAARAQQQQATRDSLVRAWEQAQKGDPETVAFEKVGERRYRFKTNRFPFDGELKVLKATVTESAGGYGDEESAGGYEAAAAVGVIEYDLVGLSEEVSEKYEHSYANWQATNTLYFDSGRRSWVTSDEYRAHMTAKYRETARTLERREQDAQQAGLWLRLATVWAPILLLLGFFVWIWNRTGIKRQREYMNLTALHMQRAEEQMQMGREHMRRSEELLERIAEAAEAANRARPQ